MSGFLRAGSKTEMQVTISAEHKVRSPQLPSIIPKGDYSVGKAWQVDVHEECNGLLLLRHLERKYQAGKWSMLPVPDGPSNV